MHEHSAVYVQDAVKRYGHNVILNKLCMNVEKGTIYGLLGASGCGKTTLLSCIVGRKFLNSGDIWVLGGTPGDPKSGVPGPRVGYMPQDIALVGEFTVKDAVYYFGRIFGIDEEVIEKRFRKLSKLLDLPTDSKLLKNCSGGQQRRVSFAASMVHHPELLILDEPTAGVDPLLRDKLWNYLVEITSKHKIAVIITTHYIEEAKQAHKIGLMREGKLLTEESPARLLEIFQVETLEDVFLILSRRQEEGRLQDAQAAMRDVETGIEHSGRAAIGGSTVSVATTVSTIDTGYGSKDLLTNTKKKKKKRSFLNCDKNRIKALMDKNWKQFYRNVTGIIFLIIFPLLQSCCFLFGVGGDIKDIKLGIVNDETMMSKCPGYAKNVTAEPYSFTSCHFHNMSCMFLEYLNHPMIHKINYDSFNKALEDAKHGKIIGVLYIPENFTESYEERSNKGKDADTWITDFSEIKVHLDMSNRQIGATMKYKLYDLFFDFQEDLFEKCKWSRRLGTLPMKKSYMFGHSDDTFTSFMTPGTLITIIFFLGSTMTSQIILTDRHDGVWDRSIVAGVTSFEITLTHFILQAGICLVQALELIIMFFVVFKESYSGNIFLILVILYLQGISGMAYGFWVSAISTDHSMANIVSSGGFLPMMLLCGLIWPIEAMPIGLRIIAKCLPFTLPIESLRHVMRRGWQIWKLEVLKGVGMGLFWTLFLITVSMYLIKMKK